MNNPNENVSMALFCDFENVALGVRDTKYQKFDIRPVLERLLLKGSIVVKKAYCDWERYKEFKAPMHEANFELIEIPHVRQSGKNSADIRLVVDALDFCYTKSHVNTFVIISGDSDFSPLVSKLRENNKKVIGVGVKQSTSDLLIANCDEFIFYDDLAREGQRTADARRDNRGGGAAAQRRTPDEERRRKEELEARKTEAVEMVVETFEALMAERGDSGKIWASALKDALKRRKPDFNESYYGFRAFGNLLEEAQSRGFLEVGREEKSGTYVYRDSTGVEPAVRSGGARPAAARQPAADAADAQAGVAQEGSGGRPARKSRGGRKTAGGGRGAGQGADAAAREEGAQASSEASAQADLPLQGDAPQQAGAPRQADVPRQVDAPRQADVSRQADTPPQAEVSRQAGTPPADAPKRSLIPVPMPKPFQPPRHTAVVAGPPPVVNVAEWTFVAPTADTPRERPAKASDPFAGGAPSPAAEPAPAPSAPAKRGRSASKTATAKSGASGAGKTSRAAAAKTAATPVESAAKPAAASAPAPEAEAPAKPARKTATRARRPKKADTES
ncbi:NYN domain-containing protein [Achromobacter sp. NPDC058515]|uniref:NYN domain-containing protein n=1 Tax=Achromobacter sp. NPDC058515 TaxID=3346533 RepID=UPI00365394C3